MVVHHWWMIYKGGPILNLSQLILAPVPGQWGQLWVSGMWLERLFRGIILNYLVFRFGYLLVYFCIACLNCKCIVPS